MVSFYNRSVTFCTRYKNCSLLIFSEFCAWHNPLWSSISGLLARVAMQECRHKDRTFTPCCMGYPTECRQISAKWRLASNWAIMSRTVPKGVDAPCPCTRIADKAFRLRARANRVQWWPQRGRELPAIAARPKKNALSHQIEGGRAWAAVGFIHQNRESESW